MKKAYWIAPLLLLTLAQFNNCSPYQQSDNSLNSLGDLTCDADCITPNPTNLSIAPVLADSSQTLRIKPGLGDFDVGGVCNEGGYPSNVILWTLSVATATGQFQKVRDSLATNALTACVNGRFRAYVRLTAINGVDVDRSGLSVGGGAPQQYQLTFTIYGQLVENGGLQMGYGGANQQTINLQSL